MGGARTTAFAALAVAVMVACAQTGRPGVATFDVRHELTVPKAYVEIDGRPSTKYTRKLTYTER